MMPFESFLIAESLFQHHECIKSTGFRRWKFSNHGSHTLRKGVLKVVELVRNRYWCVLAAFKLLPKRGRFMQFATKWRDLQLSEAQPTHCRGCVTDAGFVLESHWSRGLGCSINLGNLIVKFRQKPDILIIGLWGSRITWLYIVGR